MKRWLVAGGFLLLCAALVAVLAKGFGRDPHEVPFLLKGKPSPAFSMKRLDTGEVIDSRNLRGKPLVLNFWASWCGPCKLEHPVLNWGEERYGKDVQFVGIIYEDTEENARRYLAENGAGNIPHLFDALSTVPVDYGVSGVPETYFIDAQGVIVEKHVGPIPYKELAGRVEKLLGAPRAARN